MVWMQQSNDQTTRVMSSAIIVQDFTPSQSVPPIGQPHENVAKLDEILQVRFGGA